MLKSYGWGGVGWGGGVAHEILVSAQGPLVLGFGVWGLGPGLDNFPVHKKYEYEKSPIHR